MSIDDVTIQLRSQLQEAFGVEGASYLMDRPPGGWSDLVTNESLDRRLDAMERRIDEKFDLKLGALEQRFDLKLGAFDPKLDSLEHKLTATIERETRAQTWRLMTATIAAMAGLVAALGAFVAVTSKL